MKKLFALRGAVCAANTAEDIQTQTAALYRALLSANRLDERDIVSLVFSVTAGLDAKNPCAALRERGLAQEAALFAVQEAECRGMPRGLLRALVHCYLDETARPAHVYMNGAEALRPDRAAPAVTAGG
ncbi:MAG: chorismate mutase [Spirochaetaceae bacterium]|jgi:chorismate mutase|nr:chorismate mutase [Spirochaetaceae bacterium]